MERRSNQRSKSRVSSKTPILVEVRPSPGSRGDLSSQKLTQNLTDRIPDLADGLAEIANLLRDEVDAKVKDEAKSQWALGAISLQLSLDLQAEAGIIAVRGSATAGFHATLTWARR
jgi:hypothetical protein